MGIRFPNPVGLAAGFDKNAEHIAMWPALGFGFLEIGAVTPIGQPGNDPPRLFRLKQSRSVQNAMGFNNDGAETVRNRVLGREIGVPLGVNLGKNRNTPNTEAIQDYLRVIEAFRDCSDFFVLNLSSPNTPGLRDLESREAVSRLVGECVAASPRPVLLKVSPDRETPETVAICEAAVGAGASGIVATNTTVDYRVCPDARDTGGISGAALREKSRAMLQALSQALFGRTVLVSVGGIASADEAYDRIRMGASLIQVYTGLIYEGPGLIARITAGLADRIAGDGFESLAEAVGTGRNT